MNKASGGGATPQTTVGKPHNKKQFTSHTTFFSEKSSTFAQT
jgi:hypothetical protein